MKRWKTEELELMADKVRANWTHIEIAAFFEVTVGAVKSRLEALRKKGLLEPAANQDAYILRSIEGKARRKKDIQVEEPPRAIPPPKGAKSIPWIELENDQCQWHMNDGMAHFHDPPSNTFPCCGLPTELPNRFCEYHMKSARK